MKRDGIEIWYMDCETGVMGFHDIEKCCQFFFKMRLAVFFGEDIGLYQIMTHQFQNILLGVGGVCVCVCVREKERECSGLG